MRETPQNKSDKRIAASTPAYDNVYDDSVKHLGYISSNGRIWIGKEAGEA